MSPWKEKGQHHKAFAQPEEKVDRRRIGFIKQVSLKLLPKRCQCGGQIVQSVGGCSIVWVHHKQRIYQNELWTCESEG